MQPMGSNVTNTAHYANLTATINAAQSCAELQAMTTTIMASLNGELAAIATQAASLAPILALLTPPTSPTAAVTWIASMITAVLVPMYKPYATYALQLAAETAAIAELTAAIMSAQAKFPSCSITIPS